MPLIALIRHGENDYVKKGRLAGRLPGVHLNDTGRQQALLLAEKLAGVPFKAIYSSPLERCMETAQPLAEALKLEILPRQGLIESNYGEWQGQKVKGLSRLKAWKTVQHNPSRMRFPGGENFAETQLRIVQEIETIAGLYQEKDVVACFSHADPIRLAAAYYIGQPLDLFQRLVVSPASVTALHISEAGCRLLALNYDFSFIQGIS
jgi:probable phosphoglycerate mutase